MYRKQAAKDSSIEIWDVSSRRCGIVSNPFGLGTCSFSVISRNVSHSRYPELARRSLSGSLSARAFQRSNATLASTLKQIRQRGYGAKAGWLMKALTVPCSNCLGEK